MLLDLGLGVEYLDTRAKQDEVLEHRPDGRADQLERLVHGGYVGDEDHHLAGRDLALDHVVGAQAEHRGRAECCGRLDAERVEALAERQPHTSVHRGAPHLAEASMLVRLPAEGDDHSHHPHHLVDDREAFPLEALNLEDPGHDSRPVHLERPEEERHDRQ